MINKDEMEALRASRIKKLRALHPTWIDRKCKLGISCMHNY